MKPRACDYIFMLLWSILTLAIGIIGLPCLLVRSWSQALARLWARASLALLKLTCGIHSQMQGYNYIVKPPAIYAAKHQSTWDTLMLYVTLHNPAFVLKRSLYLIPVFGWYLWRSGQIAIDRKGGKGALDQMVAQATRYALQKRPIVIFPEGTRKPLFSPAQYKFGVARVSEATQLNVIPVALNAGKFWPRTPVAKRPGNAIIEFLPAMPPAGTAREPWLKDLENRVEGATKLLLKQA